jgi:hypothetical protein
MARKQLWRRNETAVRNDWGSWLVISVRGKIPFWGELLPEDGTFVYVVVGGKPMRCWHVGDASCHGIAVELLRSDWNPNCDDDLMIDCRFSFPYLGSR